MTSGASIIAEYRACPQLPGHAALRAYQASQDAHALITDVRDLDPRQVWGRLNLIGQKDPARLLALIVELAAYVDEQTPVAQLAAWTKEIGGTVALHPDSRAVASVTAPADESAA